MVYNFLSVDDAVRAGTLARILGPQGSTAVIHSQQITVADNIAPANFDSEFENALRLEGIALVKAAIVK